MHPELAPSQEQSRRRAAELLRGTLTNLLLAAAALWTHVELDDTRTAIQEHRVALLRLARELEDA
jgi:hypothetical protein